MISLDPARNELLADGRGIGLGQDALHFVVGRGKDLGEHLRRVLVAGLHTLEIQDREPAEPREDAGERGIDHRVHGGGHDRDLEPMPQNDWPSSTSLGSMVFGAGRQRDVFEAVGRSDLIDLRVEGRQRARSAAAGRAAGAVLLDHSAESTDHF